MSAAAANPLAPWVVTVPKHWQVFRLGSIANVIFSNVDKHTIEGEVAVGLCNYTDVYKNGLISSSIEFMQASALPREIQRFQVRKGDVLATKDSEDPNDIAVSALIAEELPNVLCGYHLALIRPQPDLMRGEYLAWVQSSKGILAQYEAQAVGVTRFAVGQAAFKEVVLPVPPLAEQRRISGYLDQVTKKVDRLVALRRRQMELLREQRAALIQQTITGGLSPNSRLKESAVLGFRQIPKHWNVKQIRHLVPRNRPVMYGIVLPGPNVDEGVPIVKAGNCEPGRLSIEMMHRTTFEIEAGYVRSRLQVGDLVYAIRGSFGHAEIVPPELEGANLTQDAARIAPGAEIDNRWLWYAVRSQAFFVSMDSVAVGATIRGVNIRDLKRGKLPVPPPAEQREIAAFLDEEGDKTERLLSAYARQLELLTEYRAALIHECVTGQRAVPRSRSGKTS